MYKWKVGELCIKLPPKGTHKFILPGQITHVTEIGDLNVQHHPAHRHWSGMPIRVSGEPYDKLVGDGCGEWSNGKYFRPLNEDDYKRIREKHRKVVDENYEMQKRIDDGLRLQKLIGVRK